MLLDGAQQALHHFITQSGVIEHSKAAVTRDLVHQGAAGFRVRTAQGRVANEQLPAAVGGFGMGVHDAARKLHKLADVSDKQDIVEALEPGGVDGVPDVVGALGPRDSTELGEISCQVVHAVISGQEDHAPVPACRRLADLQRSGLDDGALAHGLHHAGAAEDGDTAHDAELGVEGLFRDLLPLRRGDHDTHAAGITAGSAGFFRRLTDLPSRNRIYGRRAHRLVKAGLCHAANARAAVDFDAAFRFLGGGDDQHAVGHVRVVPGVLAHSAESRVPGHAAEDRLNLYRPALGRHDA